MELARGMVAENKLTCALEFPILHKCRAIRAGYRWGLRLVEMTEVMFQRDL